MDTVPEHRVSPHHVIFTATHFGVTDLCALVLGKSQDYVNGTTLKNIVWDVEIRQLINEVSIYQEMTLRYI